MIIAFLAVLGLAGGSFVNALVPRIKAKKTIVNDRSVCDHCGHVLAPKDLIPVVSWLLLRGRCRYCNKPIPWDNPATELAMLLLFVVSYLWWPETLSEAANITEFVFWLVFLVGLVAMAVYDLKWMILPNVIMYPMIIGASVLAGLKIAILGEPALELRDAVLGLTVFGGFFYLLFMVSKGRWIGGGDVKLGIFYGLLLGFIASLIALMLSFYLAAIVILPLLVFKIVSRKQAIPFGPFIIAAGIIAQLFGSDIANWYVSMFVG